MREEPIIEIGVDGAGRLFVRPAATKFDQIYRAASGVAWDEANGVLVSPEPREWTLGRWFQQMLTAAAQEYGVALQVTSSTKWLNIELEVQRDMEAFASSDWLAQLVAKQTEADGRSWEADRVNQALSQSRSLWEQGRYADYVRVLAPHRDRLSPAQLKRLAMAERHTRG